MYTSFINILPPPDSEKPFSLGSRVGWNINLTRTKVVAFASGTPCNRPTCPSTNLGSNLGRGTHDGSMGMNGFFLTYMKG